MTKNKEIKSSSTNLGVLEKVDRQIKLFQKKADLQSSCAACMFLSCHVHVSE